MRGTKRAAVAIAVVALGAVSCGTSDVGGGGNLAVPVAPRPGGTGPLSAEFVRTDLGDAAEAAGVPANAPDYGRANAAPDRISSCGVGFMGFSDATAKVDMARYETVLRELHRRGWKTSKKREERKDKAGKAFTAKDGFEQRGWRLVTEYRDGPKPDGEGATIKLLGLDQACLKAGEFKEPTV